MSSAIDTLHDIIPTTPVTPHSRTAMSGASREYIDESRQESPSTTAKSTSSVNPVQSLEASYYEWGTHTYNAEPSNNNNNNNNVMNSNTNDNFSYNNNDNNSTASFLHGNAFFQPQTQATGRYASTTWEDRSHSAGGSQHYNIWSANASTSFTPTPYPIPNSHGLQNQQREDTAIAHNNNDTTSGMTPNYYSSDPNSKVSLGTLGYGNKRDNDDDAIETMMGKLDISSGGNQNFRQQHSSRNPTSPSVGSNASFPGLVGVSSSGSTTNGGSTATQSYGAWHHHFPHSQPSYNIPGQYAHPHHTGAQSSHKPFPPVTGHGKTPNQAGNWGSNQRFHNSTRDVDEESQGKNRRKQKGHNKRGGGGSRKGGGGGGGRQSYGRGNGGTAQSVGSYRSNRSQSTWEGNSRNGTDDSTISTYVNSYSGDKKSMDDGSSLGSSEAIRMLMQSPGGASTGYSSQASTLTGSRLDLGSRSSQPPPPPPASSSSITTTTGGNRPILPTMEDVYSDYRYNENDDDPDGDEEDDEDDVDYELMIDLEEASGPANSTAGSPRSKKRDWLLRMNRKLSEIPIGELDPATMPLSAIMNAWAKTKSAQGASLVELWLRRAQQEYDAGNRKVIPTTKMYTMAVDAWAKSGEGGSAAQRAEEILQHMHELYQSTGDENLRPTTGIFNAVINAWARSREKIAPVRAEQILEWMDKLHQTVDPNIQPDKYTFNTVIHAYAKSGGTAAAMKAQQLLTNMHRMYNEGNYLAKPDTITYNVVINAWAKSGGKGAAAETEKLLTKMHALHEQGDPDIKPNVVTYGAVIDSYAKSGEKGAAERADALLANMIQLHQSDPVRNADLRPNTYVFNTVINCWAKSKEPDAASKAEEMLVAMSHLHSSGMPNLKPDAFTYTAVIDAWAKSGYRGAAARADQLLDKMEAKYMAGDMNLKPNTFTYNAVINALAKSGEPGAAARAERVLQNMVNRHRNGGSDDVKPTTINFNTVLDAWAKSGGGRQAAERAEEILEWMDRLHKGGNPDVKPDTITFNAVLDAWARSGDRMAPHRAEQILDHMDELYRAGNKGVKPDTYTYNTLINAWAKSSEKGSAARAEHVLSVMEKRFKDGDNDFKPNTRTHTSVIDAWAKSGEKGAARRAEQILNNMISAYEATGDPDVKPNVHTANAVCNACAFTKVDEDRPEALQIAFRVFDWLSSQQDMQPDAYTFTILLSVCANLLPKEDTPTRFTHAKAFFESCCQSGYVNDYVLRKLRQTVTEEEYLDLVDYRTDTASLPPSWTRNAGRNKRVNVNKGRKGGWSQRRRK